MGPHGDRASRGTGRTARLVEEAKAYARDNPGRVAVYICRNAQFAYFLKRSYGECGVLFVSAASPQRIEGLWGRAFIDHAAEPDLPRSMRLTAQAMNATSHAVGPSVTAETARERMVYDGGPREVR